ncbi:MAG: cyclic nucleotide-binding domain-containing protein [Burkholderiales bacterium]|nr:cyclic nucleotide-binding domain-containing protein [Burkholderiales bacterium]
MSVAPAPPDGLPAGFGAAPAVNRLLDALEPLGDGTARADDIYARLGETRFFSDFTASDVARLAQAMRLYRAPAGAELIREGDVEDYMVLVIEGRVSIDKRDRHGYEQSMSAVGPGAILGEMSMIDGEPRFASCIAIDDTVFAAITRDAMVTIILEDPALGAKVLIKLVTMLSARLRQTSSNLLHYLAP